METKAKGYEKKKVRLLANAKLEAQERGYTLHCDEWEGFRAKYSFTCPKGHPWTTVWAEFHRGRNCRQCHNESMIVKNPKFKGKKRDEFREERHEQFKKELEAEGYVLGKDFKYMNNQSKSMVTCPEGHPWGVTYNSWSQGKRCRTCFEKRVVKSREEIAEELAAEGCELIGDYFGANKPFKYKCVCGTVAMGRIKDFRNGVRCRFCAGEKVRETNRLKRLELLRKFDEEHPEEVAQ